MDLMSDLAKLGAEYETAREALFQAQSSIRQWAYDHPVEALNIGLLKLNYEAAIKHRRIIR